MLEEGATGCPAARGLFVWRSPDSHYEASA